MGNIFAGSEVVELGIQIERNGRDFYAILAKQAKEEKARGVFEYLAGEEEKHIRAFEKILGSTEKYEPQGLESDSYFAYMNALAGEYVFTKKDEGKKAAIAIKSSKEALDKGIGFEKDSIIFYEGIKQVVPEYEVKTIEALIREEEKHLLRLIALKKDA